MPASVGVPSNAVPVMLGGPIDVENPRFTIHNPMYVTDQPRMQVMLAALGPVMLRLAGSLGAEPACDRFVFLRHGQTARNALRVFQGPEEPLDATGESQAIRAAGGKALGLALLGNTLPTGAILFVLIVVFGPISGAHFNPAVTLVVRLRGDLSTSAALRLIADVSDFDADCCTQNFLRVGTSLRGAARRIGVSQPVLTKLVRELEIELAAPLLERHSQGVRPTPQGDRKSVV